LKTDSGLSDWAGLDPQTTPCRPSSRRTCGLEAVGDFTVKCACTSQRLALWMASAGFTAAVRSCSSELVLDDEASADTPFDATFRQQLAHCRSKNQDVDNSLGPGLNQHWETQEKPGPESTYDNQHGHVGSGCCSWASFSDTSRIGIDPAVRATSLGDGPPTALGGKSFGAASYPRLARAGSFGSARHCDIQYGTAVVTMPTLQPGGCRDAPGMYTNDAAQTAGKAAQDVSAMTRHERGIGKGRLNRCLTAHERIRRPPPSLRARRRTPWR